MPALSSPPTSTDGTIPLESLVRANLARGHTQFVQQEYKRYRVSSQRFSEKPVNVEFILICDTTRDHSGASAEDICKALRSAEVAALEAHPEHIIKLV